MTKETANKRIINFRPMFAGAILLCVSILCSVLVLFNIWFLFLMAAIYIGIVVLCILTKHFRRLIALSVVYFLGILTAMLSVSFYNDGSLGDRDYVVEGRVCEISENYYGKVLVLEGVKLAYGDEDIKGLGGRTRFMAYGGLDVEVGDSIIFNGKVKAVEMSAFRLLNRDAAFDYSKKIKYTAGLNGKEVTVVSGSKHLDEIIKSATLERLVETMGRVTGGIAYSVLFGDRSVADEEVYQSFKESGTVHLLAVSGMHVVIIAGILYFFLSLFKLNKWVRFGIMAAVLLIYCYMCGFIPSVMRATIMSLVFMLAPLLGRKTDALSSLGIACMLILFFKPLYLFDIGFQLSFSAVLAIIFCRMLLRHLPIKNRFLKSAVDISIITIFISVVTLPIITGHFGVFPIYTVFANVVIIPLFSLSHLLLCVFCLIAVPLEFMSFLLVLPRALFEVVFYINSLLVSLPLAQIKTIGFGLIGSLTFLLLSFVVSRFVMLKSKIKAFCCCALSMFCVIMVVTNNLPVYMKSDALEFHNQPASGFGMLIATGGEYYVVDPDLRNLRETEYNLRDIKISRLNGIIFSSSNNFEPNRLSEFSEKFGSPVIFVDSGHMALNNLTISGFKVQVIDGAEGKYGKLEYRNFKSGSTVLALEIRTSGSTIVVVNKNLSANQTNILISLVNFDIDYLYVLGADTPQISAGNIIRDIDKKRVCFI